MYRLSGSRHMPSSVATARVACEYQGICENRRDGVRSLIAAFRGALQAQLPAVGSQSQGACLLPSDTPIQALVVPGNEQVRHWVHMWYFIQRLLVFDVTSSIHSVSMVGSNMRQ